MSHKRKIPWCSIPSLVKLCSRVFLDQNKINQMELYTALRSRYYKEACVLLLSKIYQNDAGSEWKKETQVNEISVECPVCQTEFSYEAILHTTITSQQTTDIEMFNVVTEIL